jgi:c-di-GMP-binding flagellar brake protein YcgR
MQAKHAVILQTDAEEIAGDRRRDRRYDIQLDLRWKLIRRRRVLETGIGRTIDLSSGGIQFETDRPLPAGLKMELSISWPAMLQNMAPLQLVVQGKVVRSSGRRTAIMKSQHEFRTVGIAADHQRATTSMPALQPLPSFLAPTAAYLVAGKTH